MKVQRRFKTMNIFRRAKRFSNPLLGKQILVFLVSLALLFATLPENLAAYPARAQDNQAAPPAGEAR